MISKFIKVCPESKCSWPLQDAHV